MRKHSMIYSMIIILAIWEAAYLLISSGFVPSPFSTLKYLVQHIDAISVHVLVSFLRIFVAIVITVITGTLLGIYVARNSVADRAVTPIIYILYPIPKIAFLPLLMLFLGLGNVSKVALVSLILFFQITVSVRDSVKSIPPAYFLAIRSLGARGLQIYKHVIFPAMLPNLFTALRISVGTSISVLFFAENYATQYGIGFYIMDSWLRFDYTAMFAGIVAISIMGSGLFKLLDLSERFACKWNRS